MLVAMFNETGKTIDFSKMDPKEAVKQIVIGKSVTLYVEDFVVSVADGVVAALQVGAPGDTPQVATKSDVSPDTVNNLLALTIDDTASYDGIEEFFSDFPLRFVP